MVELVENDEAGPSVTFQDKRQPGDAGNIREQFSMPRYLLAVAVRVDGIIGAETLVSCYGPGDIRGETANL